MTTNEQKAREWVYGADLDECACSECRYDARSHYGSLSESSVSSLTALLDAVAAEARDKERAAIIAHLRAERAAFVSDYDTSNAEIIEKEPR